MVAVGMLVCVSTASIAFDLNLPGVSAPSASASGGANAEAMQEGIVQRYTQASTKIDMAQLELARAFDLNDQAAALEAQVTALKSGATLDKDGIEKQKKISDDANIAIQAKLDANTQISDEGKKHYVSSLIPFASGLALTAQMPSDLKAFADASKSQISSASLLDKLKITSKLSAGTYLASELPGYTTRVVDGFKKLVTFAKSNQIPVPKDATDLLGSL